MTAKLDGTAGLLQQYDYQTPTTGFSYTFAAGVNVLVMQPAGTLATGTITMPASPADGMTISFSSTQTITALTVNANTGQSIVRKPTSFGAGSAMTFVYRLSNTTWYPMTNYATAGTVLQVVQGTYSTETETSSSTFTDTGLTASITPSSASNKVLVIVSQDIGKRTNDLQANLRLMRGATSLGNFASLATNSAVSVFGSGNGGAYLDSPATTSATTYKTQFNSSNGLAAARVCNGGQLSTITLMEIAA